MLCRDRPRCGDGAGRAYMTPSSIARIFMVYAPGLVHRHHDIKYAAHSAQEYVSGGLRVAHIPTSRASRSDRGNNFASSWSPINPPSPQGVQTRPPQNAGWNPSARADCPGPARSLPPPAPYVTRGWLQSEMCVLTAPPQRRSYQEHSDLLPACAGPEARMPA
jgi:hypothetical protein